MRGEEGSRKIKGWMTVLLLTAAVWGGMLGSFWTGNLTVYGFSFSGELFSDAMDIDPEWAFDHNSQISAAAPEDSLDKAMEQLGIFGEMEELQRFLDRVLGDIKDSGERISFWGIMKEFIRGRSGRGFQPGRTGVVWDFIFRGKDRQPYAVSNSGIGAGWGDLCKSLFCI